MVKLGIDVASERTYAVGIAVLVAAQPNLTPQRMAAAGGATALDMKNKLKRAHQEIALAMKASNEFSCKESVGTYPPDPAALRAAHPRLYAEAYSDEEPVSSPLDPLTLSRLKAIVPCRNTKATVGQEANDFGQYSQGLPCAGPPAAPLRIQVPPDRTAASCDRALLAPPDRTAASCNRALLEFQRGGQGSKSHVFLSLQAPPKPSGAPAGEDESQGSTLSGGSPRESIKQSAREASHRAAAENLVPRPVSTAGEASSHTVVQVPAEEGALATQEGSSPVPVTRIALDMPAPADLAENLRRALKRTKAPLAAEEDDGHEDAERDTASPSERTTGTRSGTQPRQKKRKVPAPQQRGVSPSVPHVSLAERPVGGPPAPTTPQSEAPTRVANGPLSARPDYPPKEVESVAWEGAVIHQKRYPNGDHKFRIYIPAHTKPWITAKIDQHRLFGTKKSPETEEKRGRAWTAALDFAESCLTEPTPES